MIWQIIFILGFIIGWFLKSIVIITHNKFAKQKDEVVKDAK